jgi:ATPase family associated with various cellular activities (AAA)
MSGPAEGSRGPAETSPLRFAALDARIRAGVELVAGAAADPGDPFRGLYVSDEQALALVAEGPPALVDERLARIAALLGLDVLERDVLAACAAPELTAAYGRLYGYLHDDMTRQLASPRLIGALLAGGGVSGEDVLARLAAGATLRRRGALRLLDEPRLPLADRPLKCADALAAALLGGALADSPPPACELVPVPPLAPAPAAAIEELRGTLAASGELPLAIVGPDAPATLAWALRRPLLLASVAGLEDPERLPELRLAAALTQRALAFAGFQRVAPEQRDAVWRALYGGLAQMPYRGPTQTPRSATESLLPDLPERVLLCVEPREDPATPAPAPTLVLRVPAPGLPERRAAWSLLLDRPAPGDAPLPPGDAPLPPGVPTGEVSATEDDVPAAAGDVSAAVEDVATKFRLSVTQIAQAVELARARARARGERVPTPADLDHGARGASRHGLGELAGRVAGEADWDSLVLPERALRSLRLVAAFLRHRDRVLLDWGNGGAPRAAAGLTVLFAGESGTGKTLAAQVLARDLGLELFRVDLATVVSKYIGETEKNLDRIFAAAEGSNAILLFDEADALFGKRSEVRDAHDRYANVEVAYLLQRIEGYAGAVILTTNLRQNIDAGFLRRLDLVVDFPFPEPPDRERLWRRLLPAQALTESIDVPFLAARFELAGGSIRNAALAAALLAAQDGGPLRMEHAVRGVALEYDKLGRLTLEADFERFFGAVRASDSATS